MGRRYGNYDQFCSEVLNQRSGPLASAVEEIADEIFHVEYNNSDDSESLWDKADSDDD